MAANSPTERIYRRTMPRTTDEVWGMTNPERTVAGSSFPLVAVDRAARRTVAVRARNRREELGASPTGDADGLRSAAMGGK